MLLIHDIFASGTIVSHSVNADFETILSAMYDNVDANSQFLYNPIMEAMRQEALWDKKACTWYVALQYQYALIYASLLFSDIQQFGINGDSEYYETKFALNDTDEKLACNKISLRKILTDFGIEEILDL